jgi:hypothetical protein
MQGSFTFIFNVNNQEENITVIYANPFVQLLNLNPALQQQVFNLCALSFVTGILDGKEVKYTNLRLYSVEYN